MEDASDGKVPLNEGRGVGGVGRGDGNGVGEGRGGVRASVNGSPTSLKEQADWSKVPFWTSQRFLTAVVTFWGFVCLYMQRVNLSIAIVCMVKPERVNMTDDGSDITSGMNYSGGGGGGVAAANSSNASFITTLTGLVVDVTTATTNTPLVGESLCGSLEQGKNVEDIGEFTWSKEMQGLLLGSFFWGYTVLQVPGGILSEKYGPKLVVFYTMFPVGVLSLLSPVSARVSPWLFLVLRVLLGVGEGALYPSAQALFARWSPPAERSRLVGISLSGGQFGNAMIFPIAGLLCSSLGWDSVFYVMGAMGLVWSILWYILVYDSPSLSRRISPIERGYIQCHTSFRDGQKVQAKPWKAIFTSLPFWAIVMAHTCGNYGLYMLLTQIPTYMKEVLKFDLKSLAGTKSLSMNGVFSMLPYLSMWICIGIGGVLSDTLISRKILSIMNARKLMSSVGLFGPAICLIGLTFMDCTQKFAAVALLCGCVGLSGISFAGYWVNHGDIAPQFAGTLFGITNMAATFPGIIAPYVVGAITTNKTREEWQVAFFIASAIYVIGGVFYLVFCQASVQKWAELPKRGASPESRHMVRRGTLPEEEAAF